MAVVSLALFSPPLWSGGDTTSDLLRSCKVYADAEQKPNAQQDPEYLMDLSRCLYIVRSVTDTYHNLKVLAKDEPWPYDICIPQGTSTNEVINNFISFAESSQSAHDAPPALGVLLSLKKYRCYDQ